jgi:hypothetical protein
MKCFNAFTTDDHLYNVLWGRSHETQLWALHVARITMCWQYSFLSNGISLQAHILFTRDGHTLVPVQTTADTTLRKIKSFFILKQYFVIEAHSDHVVLRSPHYTCARLARTSVLPAEHGTTETAFRVGWLVEVGVPSAQRHAAAEQVNNHATTNAVLPGKKMGH